MNHPADHRATLLRERLDRLANGVPAGSGTDGAQLYRRSLRRRRRRVAASTALVAAATALVVVGGATWLPGVNDDGAPRPENDQPPVAGQGSADARAEVLAGVDDPGGRTAGQTVEVSQAEAERRCTIVWHNYWGPSAVTVKLRDDSGPWFEGDAVKIANAQEFDYSPFDVRARMDAVSSRRPVSRTLSALSSFRYRQPRMRPAFVRPAASTSAGTSPTGR